MSSRSAVDVLIVSAHLPELSGLGSDVQEGGGADFSGLRVRAEAVGIGLSAAAGGTVFWARELRPRAVVFVGTCGAYQGRGLRLKQVVAARTTFLACAEVAESRAAFPAPMQVVLAPDANLTSALAGESVPRVAVATTVAVTNADPVAESLARSCGADVEHLEAFAVVQSSARCGIPCAILLAVANEVGALGHHQWLCHHREASEAVAVPVLDWLWRGAPGLPGG